MKRLPTTAFLLLTLLALTVNTSHSYPENRSEIGSPESDTVPLTVTDIEGHTYGTVLIDNLTWMSSNLNTAHYRNGKEIPQAKSGREWMSYFRKKIGCWCYYNYDSTMGPLYGKLYSCYVATSPDNVAPEGWRVSTEKDMAELAGFLGLDSAGFKMKSTTGWGSYPAKNKDGKKELKDGNGSNESGFNALPGGIYITNGGFRDFGTGAGYWIPLSHGQASGAYHRGLYSWTPMFYINPLENQASGFFIRCVKEDGK